MMKAIKYTVTITVEVLSMDSVPSLLEKTSFEISDEYSEGNLTAEDGDSVHWVTKQEPVEF